MEKLKRFLKSRLKEGSRLYLALASVYKRANRLYRLALNKPDYKPEIEHWKKFLRDNAAELKDPGTWKRIFPDKLRPYAAELKKERPLKILELGSGPVSLLGWGVEEGMFTVVAVDPLAGEYESIMAGYGLTHPIKPVRGEGERLVSSFGKDSFDIVYASNALDHVTSPRKCFENFCNIVRPGGIIYLEGYVKAADMQGWGGMHQYNLVPSDGKLLCYDIDGKAMDLAKGLAVECVFEETMKSADRAKGTCLVGDGGSKWFIIAFKRRF